MAPFRGLRHAFELPAAKLLVGCASIIPRRLTWLLAGLIGSIAAALPGQSSRIFDINRRHVIEQCDLQVSKRRVFRYIISGFMDFFRLQRMNDDAFRKRVEVRGAENMAAALAEGRGVLAIDLTF